MATFEDVFAAALRCHEAGRLAEAGSLFHQILQHFPENVRALEGLGVVAHQSGDNGLAVAMLQRAIAVSPGYFRPHHNLGTVFRALGRPAEAEACYRNAVRLKPDHGPLHRSLADVLMGMGRAAEAVVCYRLAMAAGAVDACADLAGALQELGRHAEAVACYEQGIAFNPTSITLNHNLGVAYQRLDRTDDAVASYRRVLAIDPDAAEAYFNLGHVYKKRGRLDEAALHLDGARELMTLRTLKQRLADPRPAGGAAAASDARDLIMGLAVGYDREKLAPFVRSLRETGFAGDVVLFVGNTAPDTVAFLSDHGVIVEPIEVHHHIPFHMCVTRYITYYEYLMRQERLPAGGRRYRHIFLTDVRDVVFQADPFPPSLDHDVLFFLENRTYTIGSCASNRTWVEDGFGQGMGEELADRPISCSGTTLGTLDGIITYLLHMQILALRIRRVARHTVGIDQGIHNVMLHKRIVPNAGMVENGRIVGTIGHGIEDAHVTPDGLIRNGDGSIIPVIHQYDYRKNFNDVIKGKYGS